jgi:hypothetical protein
MDNLDFPRTINMFQWTKYLNRELTIEEKHLFNTVRMEKMLNMQLEKINENINKKNLEISYLTPLDGNCLFESLSYLGVGNNSDELRKAVCYLMVIFKDYKNFFPDQAETISELFQVFNEIEYVHCRQDSRIYKYSFEVMCQDLYEACNWTRLPTQLILMFISKIFNLNIIIIQENGFEHNIFVGDKEAIPIYLAHLSESHYLPIDKIKDNLKELEYDNCKNNFIKWASKQAFMKQREEEIEKEEIEKEEIEKEEIEKSNKPKFTELDVNEDALKRLTS